MDGSAAGSRLQAEAESLVHSAPATESAGARAVLRGRLSSVDAVLLTSQFARSLWNLPAARSVNTSITIHVRL